MKLHLDMSILNFDVDSMKIPGTDLNQPCWWKPIVSLVNFVLLGYCLKCYFGWDRNKTAKFRRFTFNVLLPIYVLRNMWIARIDSSMYDIAKISFLIHVFQACMWWLLYRNVPDESMRGWLSMISQGCLTSFFYTNLVNHGDFGHQAVAICLLWDIGGNTPCCQILLWGIAAFHSPTRKYLQGGESTFGTAYSSPLLSATERVSNQSCEREMTHFFQLRGKQHNRSDLLEEETTEFNTLLGDHRIKGSDNEKVRTLSDVLSGIVFQPILPAFAMGLMLSLYNIGCPVVVDLSLEAVGLLFKPCLYFLIGLCSDIITDPRELKIVLTALGLRYLSASLIGLAMWLWLPFPNLERTTMALSLLSPVSTMTIYLSAEYGYPNEFLSMSAAVTTISVFVSFAIQEIIMRSY